MYASFRIIRLSHHGIGPQGVEMLEVLHGGLGLAGIGYLHSICPARRRRLAERLKSLCTYMQPLSASVLHVPIEYSPGTHAYLGDIRC